MICEFRVKHCEAHKGRHQTERSLSVVSWEPVKCFDFTRHSWVGHFVLQIRDTYLAGLCKRVTCATAAHFVLCLGPLATSRRKSSSCLAAIGRQKMWWLGRHPERELTRCWKYPNLSSPTREKCCKCLHESCGHATDDIPLLLNPLSKHGCCSLLFSAISWACLPMV